MVPRYLTSLPSPPTPTADEITEFIAACGEPKVLSAFHNHATPANYMMPTEDSLSTEGQTVRECVRDRSTRRYIRDCGDSLVESVRDCIGDYVRDCVSPKPCNGIL
eukprot:5139124-Amphidinium_carterae.2